MQSLVCASESGVDFPSVRETEEEQMSFLRFSFVLLLSNLPPDHTSVMCTVHARGVCVRLEDNLRRPSSDTAHFVFEAGFHTGT
jgi:hypothetical protein